MKICDRYMDICLCYSVNYKYSKILAIFLFLKVIFNVKILIVASKNLIVTYRFYLVKSKNL